MSITVYNKENLLNHLRQLVPDGYNMNQEGQFLKQDEPNNRTIMLSFGIREQFPFGVNFFALGAGLTYHEVEQILHNIYISHPNLDWDHDLNDDTFYKDFSDSVLGRQFVIDNVDNVLVENDATFEQVRPYLQQMIDAALSFLETHQTLQDFYDFGETLAPRDNAAFYTQNSPPKRLIINKLIGISYDNQASRYINRYTALNMNANAAFIQDLKNHLDNL